MNMDRNCRAVTSIIYRFGILFHPKCGKGCANKQQLPLASVLFCVLCRKIARALVKTIGEGASPRGGHSLIDGVLRSIDWGWARAGVTHSESRTPFVFLFNFSSRTRNGNFCLCGRPRTSARERERIFVCVCEPMRPALPHTP